MAGNSRKLRIYNALESVIGRQMAMKLGRFLYFGARRELANQPEVNGEYRLIDTVVSALPAGKKPLTFLDVGANLGDWTAELLSSLRHHGKINGATIHDFEPAPMQSDTISARFATEIGEKLVTLNRLAVAASIGTLKFCVTGDDTGNNAITTDSEIVRGDVMEVPVTTIDEFCQDRGIATLDLVKVDTEGNDHNVILGAANMLGSGSIGVLQFEYNWRWIAFGHFLHSVFATVKGKPYVVAAVTQAGLEVYDGWHPELDRFVETNYALIRNDLLEFLPHHRVQYNDANAIEVMG